MTMMMLHLLHLSQKLHQLMHLMTKMKIHKEAIRRLFAANDTLLDAEQLLAIGMDLERAKGA